MSNIWWHLRDWKIVHAFIKSSMSCNFNFGGFEVIPEDVLCGARNIAEENTFARVRFQFCRASSQRSDPYLTAKSPYVGKVFRFSCSYADRRLSRFAFRQSIRHAKSMVKGIWPELDIKVCTNEKRTNCVGKVQ